MELHWGSNTGESTGTDDRADHQFNSLEIIVIGLSISLFEIFPCNVYGIFILIGLLLRLTIWPTFAVFWALDWASLWPYMANLISIFLGFDRIVLLFVFFYSVWDVPKIILVLFYQIDLFLFFAVKKQFVFYLFLYIFHSLFLFISFPTIFFFYFFLVPFFPSFVYFLSFSTLFFFLSFLLGNFFKYISINSLSLIF